MKTVIKETAKVIFYPFTWYIKIAAKNYEKMFGDNMKYVTFWM